LSMNTDEAHRRAEALFKKEQQSHEAQQAMTEYEAELQAMREKTARLRALRLARDAVNQKMRTAPLAMRPMWCLTSSGANRRCHKPARQ
jgi:hypothetical protein